MSSRHFWVELQYLPVEAEVDEETGDITISATDDAAVELAKEEAVYGCFLCNTPLNLDTVNTECPGKED